VWAWNAALAFVCGNAAIWKCSERAPLCALAVQAMVERVADETDGVPDALSTLVVGDAEAGTALVDDPRVALISATGSTAMGRAIAPRVAGRFGKLLLELGGNNGAIVAPSAQPDLALRAIGFAAMGTAGQRCTTLRRAFVHEDIANDFVARLKAMYGAISVGDPRSPGVLVGPLIDRASFDRMQAALRQAADEGGTIFGGGRERAGDAPGAYYVRPALIEMPDQTAIVRTETFAPILYVMRYRDLDEAIARHNDVPHGLSSAIFTTDVRESERFLSAGGSDCGIVNVNIGPSGAEIGGAFGGEKESGGGREAGSDAWKLYMRRATNTINYGTGVPLAQGVAFDVG
jgi:aldehyde dehydrogenase (NAD+)